MRRIFGELLGVPTSQVVACGNSSLKLMYDFMMRAYMLGLPHAEKPWSRYDKIRFLCPAPGYDRHFAITQHLGAELITVPMTENGPDMDVVERLVRDDASIKGIWCIPVYSNPTGCVYSDDTVRRLAAMPCAAPDFTIMWDNAYCVHDLYGEPADILEIVSECEKAGHPERAFVFASTSKITFSGAGVSCVASSPEGIKWLLSGLFYETISYDKHNQLVHARFLKDPATIRRHMNNHADITRPKFQAVERILHEDLDGTGTADWLSPRGGYFINLVVMPGTARRVVQLCAEAGVKLTPAGAMFPYGEDPDDANIRLAPTFPSLAELESAASLLTLCVRLAALEKLA